MEIRKPHVHSTWRAAVFAALIGWTMPVLALAQGLSEQIAALNNQILLDESLKVIALEGTLQGADLGAQLLGDAQDPDWELALSRVYDFGRMKGVHDAAIADILVQDPGLVADVTPFLTSDLGRRVFGLELEARRTMLDPAAKDAARQVLAAMEADDMDRRALLDRLVAAVDMVEKNVRSGLNGSVAFMRAMADANPGAAPLDEDEMLAQVWQNEPQIRAEVEDFLFPGMALAYAPLSAEELTDYIVFSESPAGLRLTAALMKSFEAVLLDLATHLGKEAGRIVSGQVL